MRFNKVKELDDERFRRLTSVKTTYKMVKWIEDIFIKAPGFALSGRKNLIKSHVNKKTRKDNMY